jgi:hypothetical protein
VRYFFSTEVFAELRLPHARLTLATLSFMMGALIAHTTFVQAANGKCPQYGEHLMSSDGQLRRI